MVKPTIEQKARRKQDAKARAARPGNVAMLISPRWRIGRGVAALVAGVILAGAYAPLDWGWLAWVALVPLLWLGIPSTRAMDWQMRPEGARGWWLETPPKVRAVWLGYAFGFAFFSASFLWIRVSMPPFSWPFPLLLGVYMGAYPAIWLWFANRLYRNLALDETLDLVPATDPRAAPPVRLRRRDEMVWMLAVAAAWVALEWVRSWLITGLPWNLLGVSQWDNRWLLPLTRFTGVYGISFLMVAVNAGLFLALRTYWQHRRRGTGAATDAAPPATWRALIPCSLLVSLGLVAAAGLAQRAYRLPPAPKTLKVAAIQGNLPLMRVFTESELDIAMEVYWTYTQEVVLSEHPDLVMWPETAIPAALRADMRTREPFYQLLNDLNTPMMVGLYDVRRRPDHPEDYLEYNSVVCFQPDGTTAAVYDKRHLVMFGEYTPFERWFPFLTQWFGMGRSLEQGREVTIYEPQPGVRIGFGICIEDIFPSVSRDIARQQANVIAIVTNDAWYGETAGTTQHTAHAVFRAVETLRPVMRNGNNSDTMLILPDGTIVNHLRDPETGSVFTRQAGIYHVPIWPDPPLTFYTRHGDWFAGLCVVASLFGLAWCIYRALHRGRRLHDAAAPPDMEAGSGATP